MSAPLTGETYTRLPGRKRSLWNGASLWLGSDHILLVKSSWFREQYRRFYLRDIQAIVVAPGARYHVSGPMWLFAIAWLITGMFALFGPSGMGTVWSIASVALLATWLSVSIASSCRTRLFTAVSAEELPSLYRTWTARRFLAKVRPRIEQVQGRVDAGWAAAESSAMGPATLAAGPPPSPHVLDEMQPHSNTTASLLFVASLFVGAAVDFLTVRHSSRLNMSINMLVMLLELIGAVMVLIQYRRRQLGSGLQKVAIVAMILLGLMFYLNNFTFSMVTAQTVTLNSRTVLMPSPVILIHTVHDSALFLMGMIGVWLSLQGRREHLEIKHVDIEQADIMKDS